MATQDLSNAEFLARCTPLFLRAPLEIGLDEIVTILAIPDEFGLLGKAIEAARILKACGFELAPGIEQGDLNSPRVLKRTSEIQAVTELIDAAIKRGEGTDLEFKSSLLFDYQTYDSSLRAGVQLSKNQLKSEEVLQSALKTIAAFANCDGGTLLIGVKDDQSLLGLESDFSFFRGGDPADKWQLAIKDYIQTRFKDGKTVNDYVDVQIGNINNLQIALIQVTPRNALSFLREKASSSNFLCYKRQGNRTVTVDITELEEFIDQRRASQVGQRTRGL